MAWLPASLVADEVASGALSDLSPAFGAGRLQIVAMRLRLEGTPVVDRVWREIERIYGPPGPGQPDADAVPPAPA